MTLRHSALRTITLAVLIVYALLTVYSLFGPPQVPVTTLVGLVFALLHAGQREGWRRAVVLLALVFAVALLFESVGVATGLVYGPYHYTDRLGPKFLGLVPYLIPVAWFMMSYPSYVIAERLTGGSGWRGLLTGAAVGGVVMTAWDVLMDPLMVAGGHWVWDVPGAYFGIPLQNFWGWWLTVFVTFALYGLSRRPDRFGETGQVWRQGETGQVRRQGETGQVWRQGEDAAFDRQAIAAYAITGLGMIASSLLNGRGDLALIGVFVMLPWAVMALRGTLRPAVPFVT